MFIGLLTVSEQLANMANASNFATCMSLKNQPCMTRPTLINLNPDYNRGLRYYVFMVKLDRYNGNCNTFDDPSGRMCVPSKTQKHKYKFF